MKSISNETTFFEDTADPDLLDGHLWRLSEKVSDRAKAKGMAGRVVTLKLKRADFRTLTRRVSLPDTTQSADRIYRTARGLFDTALKEGPFRLIGVGISDLASDEGGRPVGRSAGPECRETPGRGKGHRRDPCAVRRWGHPERPGDSVRRGYSAASGSSSRRAADVGDLGDDPGERPAHVVKPLVRAQPQLRPCRATGRSRSAPRAGRATGGHSAAR